MKKCNKKIDFIHLLFQPETESIVHFDLFSSNIETIPPFWLIYEVDEESIGLSYTKMNTVEQ